MLRVLARFFSFLFTFACVLIVLGVAGGGYLIFYYAKDLPAYEQLESYTPSVTTRFYAANGMLLTEYAKEKRLFVPIAAIPKRVIHAFIAAEDKNFYNHPGVDVVGVFRAALQNFMNYNQNKSLVGGSTITQQVVKNFLLTNEKSLGRKIKEAILAFRITQAYSKERILELYLNEIYLGHRSYGVAAAALDYFGKSLDELSVEDAAMLAALPKAPTNLDPYRNVDKAKERRDWVIGRMLEEGYINEITAMQAVSKPIHLVKEDTVVKVQANFFAEEVRRKLNDMYGEDKVYQGGLTVRTTVVPQLQYIAEKALKEGIIAYDMRHGWRGPVIQMEKDTLQGQWQASLERVQEPIAMGDWQLAVVLKVLPGEARIGVKGGGEGSIPFSAMKWARRYIHEDSLGPEVTKPSEVVSEGDVIMVSAEKATGKEQKNKLYFLRQVPQVNGAIVAMDPHTGKVLAMSGGYYYGDSQFNRVTQAKRQPGSAFKPFVYLAALENGFAPNSIIVDEEIQLEQGQGLPEWRPQNYSGDYYGPTPLRIGLEKSRNAMTVRLAQLIGIGKVIEIAKRMGINEAPPRNFSVVLGAAETTLLQLTNAYAELVNGGKAVTPSLIERIQDGGGKTIYKRDMRPCPGCALEGSNGVPSSGGDIIVRAPLKTRFQENDGGAGPDPKTAAYIEVREDLRIGKPRQDSLKVGFLEVPVPILEDNREQVIDPVTAYQMVSMLEGVTQRGTAVSARDLDRSVAGKTGTTNESKDTWFIGFSADMVVGVYVGFDNPRGLGHHETGAQAALPIWKSFMKEALNDVPDVPFRRPAGIKLVKIDITTGMLPAPDTPKNHIIFEAFKEGTEPHSSQPLMHVNSEENQDMPLLDEEGVY